MTWEERTLWTYMPVWMDNGWYAGPVWLANCQACEGHDGYYQFLSDVPCVWGESPLMARRRVREQREWDDLAFSEELSLEERNETW